MKTATELATLKSIPDRLRDIGCDRAPFTPDHAGCVCRLANEAADEIERWREIARRLDSRYTDDQKEWLARILATSLASGPADRVHKVNIDEWIKDVKSAFDLIDQKRK